MEVYRCNLCRVIFESHQLSQDHIRTQHFKNARGQRNFPDHTESIRFPEVRVNLDKRGTLQNIRIDANTKTEDKKLEVITEPPCIQTRLSPKKKMKKKKTFAGVEIKLDELKASEIEALMSNFFKLPRRVTPEESSRKSLRIASPMAHINIKCASVENGEDGAENLGRRKNINHKDADYVADPDGDYDFVPTSRTIRKKVERKKPAKRFACDVCGKMFAHQCYVADHKKIHERANIDRPYSCPLCYSKFMKPDSVARHFVLHLQNNPFVCEVEGCGAKFAALEHLQRHANLHTAKLQITCEDCGHRFSRSDTFLRHKKTFHLGPVKKIPYKPRACSAAMADRVSQPLPPVSMVKQEAPEEVRMVLESVQYEDHILFQDGKEIHLNGEKLLEIKSEPSPVKAEPLLLPFSVETEKLQNRKTLPLRALIIDDPVFLKLQKENPEAAKKVLPRVYNFSRQDFRCPHCEWTGSRAYFLQQHIQNFHDKGATLLNSKIRKNNVSESVNSASDITVDVICGTCGFHSNTTDGLSQHIASSHEKSTSCSTQGLEEDQVLKSPIERSKNLKKDHECNLCGLKLSSSRSLRYHHLNSHTDKNHTACKICNQICANHHSLKRHIRYVHLNHTNPYNERRKQQRHSRKKNPPSSSTNDTFKNKLDGTMTSPTTIPDPDPNSTSETEAPTIVGL